MLKLTTLAIALMVSAIAFSADSTPAQAPASTPTTAQSQVKSVVLTSDNTLVLDQVVMDDSVSKLIGKARQMDSTLPSGYPIYLFLNTPGGSIQAGMELIQFLKSLNRPVHTVTLFAASMGFQIAQNLGDRYITEFGVLMSHKASGGFEGEFGGDSSQIDSRYGMWLRRLTQLDKTTAARTNGKKTLAQYRSEYDNELWLNGEEAVQNGYADSVVNVRCDQTLNGSENVELNFFGLFQIVLEMDKCPTRTGPISVKAQIRTNNGAFMELNEFMAKGGKFGTTCRQEDEAPRYSYNGEKIEEGKKKELCALDAEVTYEKVKKQLDKVRSQLNNKRGNVVKMNFKTFIAEETGVSTNEVSSDK